MGEPLVGHLRRTRRPRLGAGPLGRRRHALTVASRAGREQAAAAAAVCAPRPRPSPPRADPPRARTPPFATGDRGPHWTPSRSIRPSPAALRVVEGDITRLDVDAIVNAANSSLLGGGGVDGAIHRAAGPELLAECRTLGGCPTGEARITGGYDLPARARDPHRRAGLARRRAAARPTLLRSLLPESLRLAAEAGLETIAFPGISTGVYGYPDGRRLRGRGGARSPAGSPRTSCRASSPSAASAPADAALYRRAARALRLAAPAAPRARRAVPPPPRTTSGAVPYGDLHPQPHLSGKCLSEY